MKKIIYFVAIGFSVLFASQVLAHELRVLSGEKSQNSQKWQEEVLPEYAASDPGKNLPANVIAIQGNNFPEWLNEALQDGRVGEIIGTPTFIIWDVENKKELGRVEGYTQKPRFYDQLNEALAMVAKGLAPGRREGSGGDHQQQGSGREGSGGDRRQDGPEMSRDIMDHMYKTPEEAKRASEMLGFEGEIHSHENPDGAIYMPGPMM